MAPIYRLIIIFLSLIFVFEEDSKAQCVAFINQIGDTVNNPTYTNCMVGATPANVNLSFQIASTLNHPFTINWGDGQQILQLHLLLVLYAHLW
jgi:hypothetical protein